MPFTAAPYEEAVAILAPSAQCLGERDDAVWPYQKREIKRSREAGSRQSSLWAAAVLADGSRVPRQLLVLAEFAVAVQSFRLISNMVANVSRYPTNSTDDDDATG